MKKLGNREPSPSPQDALRERRLAAAGACRAWTEFDRSELVERERGYLVHAETDEAFLPYRGDAFSPSGMVVADMTPLAYIVRDGDVLVLERLPSSWTEIVYQRARAGTRAR